MSHSFWSMPSMRDLLGPDMYTFGTPVVPPVFLPLEPAPLFPEAIGQLLAAASGPPPSGPPWTHTFQHPLPETVLVEGDEGMVEVERWPLLPHYTITRIPEFTGVLSYLEDR